MQQEITTNRGRGKSREALWKTKVLVKLVQYNCVSYIIPLVVYVFLYNSIAINKFKKMKSFLKYILKKILKMYYIFSINKPTMLVCDTSLKKRYDRQ